MRKLLLVIPALIFFSCKSNQDCKDEIFGDSNWSNTNTSSKGYYDNLRFGNDDTLTYDYTASMPQQLNKRYWFKFTDDCSGFYIVQETPLYLFKITDHSTNYVRVVNNNDIIELHR